MTGSGWSRSSDVELYPGKDTMEASADSEARAEGRLTMRSPFDGPGIRLVSENLDGSMMAAPFLRCSLSSDESPPLMMIISDALPTAVQDNRIRN